MQMYDIRFLKFCRLSDINTSICYRDCKKIITAKKVVNPNHKAFTKSGKPVVWTMHDMWELTAICHHAYECDRYETECRECQFLRFPGKNDLAHRVFSKKKKAMDGKVTYVAVSKWLAERALRSKMVEKTFSMLKKVL